MPLSVPSAELLRCRVIPAPDDCTMHKRQSCEGLLLPVPGPASRQLLSGRTCHRTRSGPPKQFDSPDAYLQLPWSPLMTNLGPAGVALAGLLVVLHASMDMKTTLAGKHPWLLYTLAPAMRPRMLLTLDTQGQLLSCPVRVGQAVDVVAQVQAWVPKTFVLGWALIANAFRGFLPVLAWQQGIRPGTCEQIFFV